MEAVAEKYRRLTLLLLSRGLTVTTMESATAGLLISLITDTEGSSGAVKGSFVTYSNEAKRLQGVPAEIIDTCSVYSEQTAQAMADVCRRAYAADIGIGVTGTFGNPDPANPGSSEPGRLYFAFSFSFAPDFACARQLAPQPDRLHWKLTAADIIVDTLFEQLKKADIA